MIRLKLESGDFAGEDIPEHPEVSEEAVEGILESCRAVLFKHKVPNPREAITEDR